MAKKKSKSPGTLAENRKARHDYNIEDTIEAGIALLKLNPYVVVVPI